MKKKTVYIPVKVEDEKPEYDSKEFTIDSKNRKSVHHYIQVPKNHTWYDKNGFLNFGEDSYVTHWLREKKLFVFTSEQLEEVLSNFYVFATEGEICKHEIIEKFLKE
ncbi:hypothetical protein [Leptolyngbya phage Lbo-JY46]